MSSAIVYTPTEDLYRIAQTIVSSGSGRGNSYWEVAANCGHQRTLFDTLGKRQDGPQPDWAIRGTYYHLLQQWYQDGRIPENQVSFYAPPDDLLWIEATTLFKWFVETFPKDAFGRCSGTEVQVPPGPEAQARVAEWFGLPFEWCPTGRYDAVMEINEDQCEWLARLHGVLLPGPGRYILDHKHGGTHSAQDVPKFTQGVQPVLYLTLDRILNPSNPARGMIFPKVSMTKEKGALKLKDTSFRIHVAIWEPHFARRAKQMILNAYNMMDADQYNGYACGDCPFHLRECMGFDPNI